MNSLVPIEHKQQRVLTTAQIADAYETDIIKIRQNYTNNRKHYEEGKHFYKLEGDTLQAFKNKVENFDLVKHSRHLILWTEKGALLHAKSLNTDKAWEVYDQLVETYFKARDMFTVPDTFSKALQLAADLQKQLEETAPKVLFADTVMKSKDSILVRELAKIACGEGLNTGEHRLYRALRKWGLLNQDNEPYQQYVNRGFFEIAETPYDTEVKTDWGTQIVTRIAKTTRVLPRGQEYIINRLKAVGE